MQALRLQGVAFGYADAAPLFDDVDVSLAPGWHGLVGENGSGKSTLLALFAGALAPDEGRVVLAPDDAVVITCPQEVTSRGADVDALAGRDDADAYALRAALRLDAEGLARWESLSPGERKRWQVGAAVARDPDVLLVDEPTNHLDADARAWLVGALRRFRGIGVVVSHDRALLGMLTTRTLRVHRRGVRAYAGAYDEAKRAWELEARAAIAERAAFKDDRDRAEARLDDARRSRASAERALSSRTRMKGVRDHDGRSMGRKVAAGRAEASLARIVTATKSDRDRAEARLASADPIEKEIGGAIFVGCEPSPRARVLSLHAEVLRAGDRVLARDVAFDIPRDARVRVAGPNGAGKTTLLRALLADSTLAPSRVLALPQDTTADDDARALDEVRRLAPLERGRVLSFVAALGVDPARLLASSRPSPGEARKLRIAVGLGLRVYALVLDEPTNHLDLPSIERLERALDAYAGALVLVTHDDAFAAACRCETWRLDGERLVRA